MVGFMFYLELKREYIQPPIVDSLPLKITESLDSQFTLIDLKLDSLMVKRDTIVNTIVKYRTEVVRDFYAIKPSTEKDSIIQSINQISKLQ